MMCGGDYSGPVGIMTANSPKLRQAGWQIYQEWLNNVYDALV
jgi:hypothetical protein